MYSYDHTTGTLAVTRQWVIFPGGYLHARNHCGEKMPYDDKVYATMLQYGCDQLSKQSHLNSLSIRLDQIDVAILD